MKLELYNNLIRSGVVEVVLGCAQCSHNSVENTELSSRKGTDHYATGCETDRAQLKESDFRGNIRQTGHHGTVSTGSLLVDLGKKSISRVGDDGRSNSSNDTRKKRNSKIYGAANLSRCLSHRGVNRIGSTSLDDEFGASVWDLLRKDGKETSVETSNSFGLGHFRETIGKTVAKFRVRDRTNADGFQGTKENVSNELGTSSRSNVDGGLAIPGLFFSHVFDGVDLEKFNSSEFEPSLNEISGSGGSKSGGQCHSTLFGNNLTESTNQPLVVLGGVQLHTGLHYIDWREGSVGDGAANSTSGGSLHVVHSVILRKVRRGGGEEYGTGSLHCR
mmetsp:Transcript_42049/g.64753  ORF Transcript_42049/g.64753 Transcript_42049/m.64753 type:complete len:332 (-) Transcript_42049:37-1032(-)